MKKILIALSIVAAFIATTAFITTGKDSSVPGPGNMCKIVGNCSVNLVPQGEGKYYVSATNNNSYSVTVQWVAMGYKDGDARRCGSGAISVGAGKNNSSQSFTTKCEDVYLDEVRVLKCD